MLFLLLLHWLYWFLGTRRHFLFLGVDRWIDLAIDTDLIGSLLVAHQGGVAVRATVAEQDPALLRVLFLERGDGRVGGLGDGEGGEWLKEVLGGHGD